MISNVAPGGQVALSVGPAQRNYMLEEGPTYDVFISQKNGEDSDTLTDFTIDSKEFLNTQHAGTVKNYAQKYLQTRLNEISRQ